MREPLRLSLPLQQHHHLDVPGVRKHVHGARGDGREVPVLVGRRAFRRALVRGDVRPARRARGRQQHPQVVHERLGVARHVHEPLDEITAQDCVQHRLV